MDSSEHVEHLRIKNIKLIHAQTWFIQIHPNHYFDHNLNFKYDFGMNPFVAT
jgi:hypothetical protein